MLASFPLTPLLLLLLLLLPLPLLLLLLWNRRYRGRSCRTTTTTISMITSIIRIIITSITINNMLWVMAEGLRRGRKGT